MWIYDAEYTMRSASARARERRHAAVKRHGGDVVVQNPMVKRQCKNSFADRKTGPYQCGYASLNTQCEVQTRARRWCGADIFYLYYGSDAEVQNPMAKTQCKHSFSDRKAGSYQCGYTSLNAKCTMRSANARGGGMPLIYYDGGDVEVPNPMVTTQGKHSFSDRKTGSYQCGYTTLDTPCEAPSRARGGGTPLIDFIISGRSPKPNGEHPI